MYVQRHCGAGYDLFVARQTRVPLVDNLAYADHLSQKQASTKYEVLPAPLNSRDSLFNAAVCSASTYKNRTAKCIKKGTWVDHEVRAPQIS